MLKRFYIKIKRGNNLLSIREWIDDYRLRRFLWKEAKDQVRKGFKSGRFIFFTGWLREEKEDGSADFFMKSNYYKMHSLWNAHICIQMAEKFLRELKEGVVLNDHKGTRRQFTIPLSMDRKEEK